MPLPILPEPEIDEARLAEAAERPTTFGEALGVSMAPLTGLAFDAGRAHAAGGRELSAEAANGLYGVPGFLSFDKPVSEGAAAVRQEAARRRAYQADVLSRGQPLSAVGAGFAGAVLDPVGLPLMFAPELLGVRGAVEGAAVARGVGLFAKSGRLAGMGRGAVLGGTEGMLGGVAYEIPNYGLRRYLGEDDYTLGDSLQNVLLGGLFGAGAGGALGSFFPEAPAPRRTPGKVAELPDDARLAAAHVAIEDVIADRPVGVAALIDQELTGGRPAPAALAALDEADAAPAIPARLLEDAVAVTTRGTEVPVRYALVELDDLVTSHTDDLERNPAFPEALQPRDRSRAGSQAGNFRLEAELAPKRLMRDAGAETGAPLASPAGVVESGNGRAIALRRSARTGGEAYGRYKAELAAQGFDTAGMDKPVLVRLRTAAMRGEARAALTREMNAAPTEAFGPAEQAAADARAIDDAALSALDGTPEGTRAFARAFIAKVAPDQQNQLADAKGALSAAGAARIKAALMARAYDDPRLVAALFEAADPNIKTLGAALAEAAPGWAKMRSLAARGEIPAELDVTASLRAAVDLIRHARDNRLAVDETIAQAIGQVDMFTGQALPAETEAFLRLFFRDGTFTRHRSADRIGWALDDYARQASQATPGPNLFGETADGDAKLILAALNDRFARDAQFPEPGDLADLAPPPRPVVADVLTAPRRDPGGDGLQPGGGEGPGRGVADAAPAKPAVAIDPELEALAAADEAGLEGELATLPKDDPATIAEAVRAAAFCLKEGGG